MELKIINKGNEIIYSFFSYVNISIFTYNYSKEELLFINELMTSGDTGNIVLAEAIINNKNQTF